MRLQKISIFYLVAFFALLPSIGNIWSGENSLAKSTHWPSDGDRVEKNTMNISVSSMILY